MQRKSKQSLERPLCSSVALLMFVKTRVLLWFWHSRFLSYSHVCWLCDHFRFLVPLWPSGLVLCSLISDVKGGGWWLACRYFSCLCLCLCLFRLPRYVDRRCRSIFPSIRHLSPASPGSRYASRFGRRKARARGWLANTRLRVTTQLARIGASATRLYTQEGNTTQGHHTTERSSVQFPSQSGSASLIMPLLISV